MKTKKVEKCPASKYTFKCVVCDIQFVDTNHVKKRKTCSRRCSAKLTPKRFGKDHPMWTGDNVTYRALHSWLGRHFGKSDKCENKKCRGFSKKYNWALKRNYKYERKIENFMRLCRSCHSVYDFDGAGIYFSKQSLKWVAQAKEKRCTVRLGSFKEKEDAVNRRRDYYNLHYEFPE